VGRLSQTKVFPLSADPYTDGIIIDGSGGKQHAKGRSVEGSSFGVAQRDS